MMVLRAILAGLLLLLGALILIALADGSFSEAGDWLLSHPWGIVSLADLYAGFAICALLIWWFEKRAIVACFWIAPIFLLGNVWTLAWLIYRLPAIRNALREN